MDNRRLLIAVVLSFALLVAWHYLVPVEQVQPPAPEGPPAVEQTAPASPEVPPPERAAAEQGTGGGDRAAEPMPAVEQAPAGATESGDAITAEREERVVVDTERFRAELTNRGAQIVSFQLKKHVRVGGGELDLVRSRRPGEPYPFAVVAADLAPTPLDEALFELTESTSEAGRRLSFRYRGPAGDAEKTFTFLPNGLFDVEVRVDRPAGWGLWLGPGIRNPTPAELDNKLERRGGVYKLDGEVSRLDGKKTDEEKTAPAAGLAWAGLEDHYFLTAVIPQRGVGAVRYEPVLVTGGDADGGWTFAPLPAGGELTEAESALQRELALVVVPADGSMSLTAFWGAKEIRRLAELPYSLGDTLNLGWFGFFARYLFTGLVWIHDHVVHNYGWSIVLLTFVIKLVLLPLTHKSYVSMRKMQKLQPKMKAIRERYRSKLKDKQGRPNVEAQRKMNEEIMGLYKVEGVNPAGGCLPMLVQLPVLFAFYRLLGAAVELRNAPWLLWISDLSVRDPYYVLPIVMGATQFIQQRMTPASGDPMQRRVFMLMPVFMTFLFAGFPSGLVLYWLTNNVLTILQQGLYNRFSSEGGTGTAGEKGKKKGKGGSDS